VKNQTTIKKVSTAKSWLHPLLLPFGQWQRSVFFSNRAEKRASGERDMGMLVENFRVRIREIRDIEQSDRCGAADRKYRLIMKRQEQGSD